jgi:hypothetical protein
VLSLADILGIKATVWSGQGHNLEHATVADILDIWLQAV